MSKRSGLIVAVMIPLVFFAAWIGLLAYRRTMMPLVWVAASGYDPRDLISGHYLNLLLDWDQTDCSQFAGNQCPREEFESLYRFYIPESEAITLERAVQQNGEAQNIRLIFRYQLGQMPLLENMKIDGADWQDWLQHRKQEASK